MPTVLRVRQFALREHSTENEAFGKSTPQRALQGRKSRSALAGARAPVARPARWVRSARPPGVQAVRSRPPGARPVALKAPLQEGRSSVAGWLAGWLPVSREFGSERVPPRHPPPQRRESGRLAGSGGRRAPWRRPRGAGRSVGSVRRSPRAARGGALPYIARGPRRPGWLLARAAVVDADGC